jgi:hypothetical protein
MDINLLSDLIKTMGKSEKRFFKMTASTEETDSSHLTALFNVLEKEEMGPEKALKSLEGSENQVAQLYNLILKSLRNFYSESNSAFRIKDDILNLRCLIDKAQYKQSRKMLSVLKRTLYESEEFSCLLKTFDVEKKLTVFEGSKALQTMPQAIAREEQSIINKQLRIINYHRLLLQIKQPGKEEVSVLEGYLKHKLLQEFTETQSMKERVFVLKCKRILLQKLHRFDEAHLLEKEELELLHRHEFLQTYFKFI